MTLQLGGGGAITGCTSLQEPDLIVSGLTVNGDIDAPKIIVSSGTAAAPSYTFSGDTDNGLYYAGTNSIGLATAGTNVILIDSTGNVGIGTTNPATTLELSSSDPRLTIRDTDEPTRYTQLRNTGGDTYLSQISSGSIIFGAPSERMRITSGGNVGIGTTSPSFRLHSYDTTAAQGFFNGWSSGGTFDAAGAIRFGNQTSYQGRIDFDPSGNTNFIFENSYLNGSISWKINGGEKARLAPTGQLLVGTSVPFGGSAGHCFSADESISGTGAVTVLNTNTGASNPAASFGTATNSSATTNFLIKFFVNGFAAGSGAIVANGTSQAAFATYSDARLKENITDLPSQWQNFKALRPVEFDYIESKGGGHQLGFIAQEVAEVFNDLVGEGQDQMLIISGMGKNESRLIKALQEAMERIETLETEVALLRSN